MILTIAQNDFYSISVNLDLQRLYIRVNGLWNSAKLVPNYCEDVQKAIALFDWKFTCLADFSEMRPYSQEVEEALHIPVLKALANAGIERSAQIMPRNQRTIDALESLGKRMKIRLNMFDDPEFAEMYLDYVRV